MSFAPAARAISRPQVVSAVSIRRRFLQVGARRVHYLRAGEGPPAVLVHSSPANAGFLRPEIERLAQDHTVFAFDTPGFGLSQPLPGSELKLADLADALAETLDAIGMPACPMFGTHTGCAIALVFGARHPGRVTGLVLDGVPAFTPAEFDALFGGYFRAFPVSDLGGHYTDIWTRFRDQSVWFPWTGRRPQDLNAYDLATPENTQVWVSMYFEAAESYMPAYRAALSGGEDVLAAAAALEGPAIYTATDTDMLYPHLQRLPPLKPGQSVQADGVTSANKLDLIAEGFARFAAAGPAPADRDAVGSAQGVQRQMIDRADGGQLHMRYAGSRDAPALLLLHDAPGAAGVLEPLIQALAARWFVLAPDLPGCGESDPFASAPLMADYTAALGELLDRLAIPRATVYGVGFGASAAVELASAKPGRVEALVLEGLLAPDPAERAELKANYTPPIPISADGSHWYRTWLMLRDSLIWWPWYTRRRTAQRATPGDFGAEGLHAWTREVMRRRESYSHLIQAALGHEAVAALARVRAPIVRVTGSATPLAVYDAALRALAPDAPEVEADADPVVQAARLSRVDLLKVAERVSA